MTIALRAVGLWALLCIAATLPRLTLMNCLLLAPLGVSSLVLLQMFFVDWAADKPRRGPDRWR